MALAPLIRVVACGSVDDGKSTLIGRLLAETGSVPEDQLHTARTVRRAGSTIPAGEIDFSLLTDGLEAEREQGITIDVAYRHLLLPSGRRAVIADAPGHEQYTRNMAVAASTADVAVLVVDAERGVRRQTFRHLTICALMGVRHVVIAVNKLDLVGYDREVYDRIAGDIAGAAARLEIPRVQVVPVSALGGDNVIDRSVTMTWYGGPTVLESIEAADADQVGDDEVRLPVQTIVRAPGFRGVAGTLASGSVSVGDKLVVSTRGETATVTRIAWLGGDRETVTAGEAVCFELEPEIDVARGDVLVGHAGVSVPADRFSADIVWMGEQPLAHGRSYLLVCGPITVPVTVTAVRHKLDVENGRQGAARVLTLNEVGRIEMATDRPVPLDPYQLSRHTGGFVLVDRLSADTVAGGMVRFALRRSSNVTAHAYEVDRSARERLNGHHAKVVWLTGLSGSGKSTIADAAERALHAQGVRTFVLDGDNVRSGLNKDLGFTPEDRAENVRRVAEVAKLMMSSGVVVLVALVSPFRSDRRNARDLFDAGDFVEVFVDTPLDVCRERDVKGLYAKAAGGELPNLSGVGQDYEPPLDPELVVSGTGDVERSVEAVVAAVLASGDS
ncbi:MAG: adenylyl-sulfate kinase [Frankiales bacterium]|nr:adenylyl-sulfate kinase [Frankiales bacterium]